MGHDSAPMFDPDDLPITTSDGRRPSSTTGDRLMVGLAALALAGGALIAIGKVLPQSAGPQTSEATATAEPTVASSRTPRPTPTPPPLRSFSILPGSPVDQPARPIPYGGWVRALEDVTIWSSIGPNASEVGVLHAGDAGWVDEVADDQGITQGWFQMQIPTTGWIRAEVDGRAVLRLFRWNYQSTGWIGGLVAGPEGFVAAGYSPQAAGEPEPVLAASTDGRSWRSSHPSFLNGYYGLMLAHGPAGWLTMSHVEDATGAVTSWIWQSADLSDWRPLGSIPDAEAPGDGFGQLVATESGYVLMTHGGGRGYGVQRPAVWYSTDGVLWSERRAAEQFPDAYSVLLTATPLGFYVHSTPESDASMGAFSPDGWTWSAVATEEIGPVTGVASAGEHLVAIDRSGGGRARAWLGTIAGDQLSWSADPAAGSAFEGAVVTAMVSDGSTPIAFGWERGTDVALWWSRTGGAWQRHRLPPDYHGIPRVAAGGPAGYVLVESRPSALGDNPVLWSLTDGRTWRPEANPVIEPVGEPTASQCAELSTDIIDLVNSARLRVACVGDATVTVRAYSHVCDGCSYYSGGRSDPAWLIQPTDASTLYLSPVDVEGWDYLSAVLPPHLEREARWEGRWLDVSGHFDDPASASCRREPPPDEEYWYGGRQTVIDECRVRFVVTRVRVVR